MATTFRSCRWVLALSGALILGVLAPVFGCLETAGAASGGRSLDACVVEPGFATPGDTFGLLTIGPKNFTARAQLPASACGTTPLPTSGTYTVTQSQTPSGWHLAQIYCYAVGSAATANGTVDLGSATVTVKVKGPTACIFAELPGGAGASLGGSGSSQPGATTTTKPRTSPSASPTVTTVCFPYVQYVNPATKQPVFGQRCVPT